MSVFDLIVLVILIALVLRGVMKGMVSQIVSVGSLIVCWIVASRFAFVIAPSVPAEEPWNNIGAMIVLFVITMIAIRFVHAVIEKKLKDWHLAGLNRYLGGGLGFVKGLLVCMVLTFFGVMLSETTRTMVFQSKSGHHLARLIAKTGAFIPTDSCEMLRTQIDQFNTKVSGTYDLGESDDDYLHRMLSAQGEMGEEVENALQNGSKIGDLLSRSGNVLAEMQSLRDEFQEETSGAASLLDAVGRWWRGEAKDTKEETVTTEKKPEPPPISLFTETKKPPIVEQTPSSVNSFALPEAPKSPTTSVSATLPPPPDPTYRPTTSSAPTAFSTPPTAPQTVTTTSPAQREETLFRAPQSYAPPTAEELANLLPNSVTNGTSAASQPAVASPSTLDPIATGAMAIPRSSFRLSRPMEGNSRQLLDSTRSDRSDTPATLFTPRRP